MKPRYLGLLILMFSSLTAAAFPHVSPLNQLVQKADPDCNDASSSGGFREFLQQINIPAQADDNGVVPRDASGKIIKKDPRGSLVKLGPKLGMSPAEIERGRQTTGYVVCPGTKYNNPAQGSGALVGQDGMQVLTSAHAFLDENGLFREPLSDCFFQNQADPAKRTALNFSTKDVYKLFTQMPYSDSENDLAIVRIKEKITNLKPFPIDDSGAQLKKGQKLIMISSSQERMKEPVPATMPIVQGCKMMSDQMKIRGSSIPLRGIFSDCAGTLGASGSITLARINGELVIKGLLAGGGKDSADYLPFNIDPEAKSEDRSYSHSAEITPGVAEQVNNFEAENSRTRTARDDSPVPKTKSVGQGI
ncbi:MAG: S1 family peptidase [Bdellovibrionales bacterium]